VRCLVCARGPADAAEPLGTRRCLWGQRRGHEWCARVRVAALWITALQRIGVASVGSRFDRARLAQRTSGGMHRATARGEFWAAQDGGEGGGRMSVDRTPRACCAFLHRLVWCACALWTWRQRESAPCAWRVPQVCVWVDVGGWICMGVHRVGGEAQTQVPAEVAVPLYMCESSLHGNGDGGGACARVHGESSQTLRHWPLRFAQRGAAGAQRVLCMHLT